MKERLKVRAGKNYCARFTSFELEDVNLVRGPMTPLTRLNVKLDSLTFVGPGYDLIHTFNAIPLLTRAPFIVTFEDYCPRVPADRPIPWLEGWLDRILFSDRCLAIVAMSHYGFGIFRRQHRHFQGLSKLLAKTRVIYPGIDVPDVRPKKASDKLRLLFVGLDFMRKGGAAVLEAHRRLVELGVPAETTIVSGLRWSEEDYIGPPDRVRCREILKNGIRGCGVRYFPGLPNTETRELMRQADFVLLPTFHETFGFVTLEALSRGTPVVASSTCAQKEVIEHGRSGFLLDFDNDPAVGHWRWLYGQDKPGYVEAYWQTSKKLTEGLVTTLCLAWERRKEYEALSAGALDRVKARFSVAEARRHLAPLYQLAAQPGKTALDPIPQSNPSMHVAGGDTSQNPPFYRT